MSLTSVFTQFTLNGPQCSNHNNFTIDTCNTFCEGTGFAQIKLNNTNNYVFSVFEDNDCTTLSDSQPPLPFKCNLNNTGDIGDYTVQCKDSVKIINFNNFDVYGVEGSTCSDAKKVTFSLDSCNEFCGNHIKIVSNDKNVNGYTLQLFSDNICSTANETDSLNLMCQPDNQVVKVGDYINIVCSDPSSNSGASTVAFSLVLFIFAILFNFLL